MITNWQSKLNKMRKVIPGIYDGWDIDEVKDFIQQTIKKEVTTAVDRQKKKSEALLRVSLILARESAVEEMGKMLIDRIEMNTDDGNLRTTNDVIKLIHLLVKKTGGQ